MTTLTPHARGILREMQGAAFQQEVAQACLAHGDPGISGRIWDTGCHTQGAHQLALLITATSRYRAWIVPLIQGFQKDLQAMRRNAPTPDRFKYITYAWLLHSPAMWGLIAEAYSELSRMEGDDCVILTGIEVADLMAYYWRMLFDPEFIATYI